MQEKLIFPAGNQLKAFPFSTILSRRLPVYLPRKAEIKLTEIVVRDGRTPNQKFTNLSLAKWIVVIM